MFYALMGYAHAAVTRRLREIRRLAGETGQGTVEYVGLILLVSLLMVGMVAAMKGFNRYPSKGGYYTRQRTKFKYPAIDSKAKASLIGGAAFSTGSVSGTRETANWSPAR